MKRRIYFIFGDMISNVIIGSTTGVVSRALVNEAWRAVPAMAEGMVLGSVIAVAASLVFMLFFGDFEIMLPGMFSGMLSGMFTAIDLDLVLKDVRTSCGCTADDVADKKISPNTAPDLSRCGRPAAA